MHQVIYIEGDSLGSYSGLLSHNWAFTIASYFLCSKPSLTQSQISRNICRVDSVSHHRVYPHRCRMFCRCLSKKLSGIDLGYPKISFAKNWKLSEVLFLVLLHYPAPWTVNQGNLIWCAPLPSPLPLFIPSFFFTGLFVVSFFFFRSRLVFVLFRQRRSASFLPRFASCKEVQHCCNQSLGFGGILISRAFFTDCCAYQRCAKGR